MQLIKRFELKYIFFWFSIFRKKFVLSDNGDGVFDTWEDPHMICPDRCVCQRLPFMNLSVASWIQELRHDNHENTKGNTNAYRNIPFNEVFFHIKLE